MSARNLPFLAKVSTSDKGKGKVTRSWARAQHQNSSPIRCRFTLSMLKIYVKALCNTCRDRVKFLRVFSKQSKAPIISLGVAHML
jgi:hypothetical protein